MRHISARPRAARHGVLFAAIALAAFVHAFAQDHPRLPEPPRPPKPPARPDISLKGVTVRPGETRNGDLFQVTPGPVSIEGTLDGDMWVTAPNVRISGVVTGDVFTAASQVDITGQIKGSLRCAGANVNLDGKVDEGVTVTGGALLIGSNAHVIENVSAFGGQLTHHGVIDGSLQFTGGTAVLGGKVLGDAEITADKIEIESGAHIDGDVAYSTRNRMDEEIKAITGGDVEYDEDAVRDRSRRDRDRDRDADAGDDRRHGPSTFGIGVRIAFFVASFLFGCALLALFRHQEPKVNEAIGNDTLRSAGIGFVSILVTIAVCLSMILLITIPFVLIYLLGYAVALYLAKIPVAVYTGRRLIGFSGRETGPFAALFVGLVALNLVFWIPYIGPLAYIAVTLVGLGAMISVFIAQRQARKAAAVPSMPEAPPAAS